MNLLDHPHGAVLATLTAYAWTGVAAALPELALPLPPPPPMTSVPVLAAAALGVVGGFMQQAETNRRRLLGLTAIYTAMSAALVTILPLWLGWAWLTVEVRAVAEPPLALLIGFGLRWMVPLFVEIAPLWMRKKYGPAPSDGKGPSP